LTSPDTAAPADVGRRSQLPSFFGGRSRQTIRTLGLVVVLASVVMSSVSFLVMTGATSIEPAPQLWTAMWIINGLLVLSVIALVVTEAVLLVQSFALGEPGARLTLRMVGIFAFAASVPAVLVAVVAMISLNQG